MPPFADVILLNGLTVRKERVNIALVGQRIAEVVPAGELSHKPGPRSRVLDIGGRLVTPGLWDSHIHLYHWCQMRHQLQLAECANREELLAMVGGAPQASTWLLGHGWNIGRWSDPRPPTRQELDAVTGDRPTLLWCSDLHSALANTAALSASGLLEGLRVVTGGLIDRDAEGSPTGWVRELAANIARDTVPAPDHDQMLLFLQQAQTELHRLGITGICDQRIKEQNDGPPLFRLLRELELAGKWHLRTNLNVAAHHLPEARLLGLATGFGSDRLRLGHLKVFADGTIGSLTARMLEPLLEGSTGPDHRGLYLTPPEEMRPLFAEAARAGFSISVHAIGDEANRVCLDLFEELDSLGIPRPRVPHRIEHAQMVDDADIDRYAKLGVVISAQAGQLIDDREGSERALGERARLCYRYGDLWRARAVIAFGTDAPVSAIDPRYGLRAAVSRCLPGQRPWYPEQRLPAEAVWDGYTLASARAAGWNDLVGSLTPGLRGDLVVWQGDPTADAPVPDAVSHTFFDGKLVYESRST